MGCQAGAAHGTSSCEPGSNEASEDFAKISLLLSSNPSHRKLFLFFFFFPLPKGRNARVNEAHWKRNRLKERKALLNIRMLECIQSGAQTRYAAIISPRYFKLLYPRIVFYHYISTRSFSCIRVSSCELGEKIRCEYVLFLRIHLLPSSVINHILTIN